MTVLLKVVLVCVVGLIAGVGYEYFGGSTSVAPLVGLLASCGSLAYIELSIYVEKRYGKGGNREKPGRRS